MQYLGVCLRNECVLRFFVPRRLLLSGGGLLVELITCSLGVERLACLLGAVDALIIEIDGLRLFIPQRRDVLDLILHFLFN